MEGNVIYFVPLLTLTRNTDQSTDCVWDCIEFMDLNFNEDSESIALCDGEGFYLKNSKVKHLFELVRNGDYKLSMEGFSLV